MTSSLASAIEFTLETVAARVGDPGERIYARLFAENPSYEPLFEMDVDGGVRANMMQTSLMCILGMAEGSETPRFLLEAAHIQHEGYGLTDQDMAVMFRVMRDEFKAILDAEWSPEIDVAWSQLLANLADLGDPL